MNREPSSDQPIDGSSDKPDLLHRKEFAVRVGKVLAKAPSDSSMVASLEGPWGSGKTSVFEMICRYIESLPNDSRPVIVRFNPWEFSGIQNLVREFLVQFGTALQLTDKSKALIKAGDEMIRYSAIFDFMKFLPGAEPWATILKSLFSSAGEASGKIGELKSLNSEAQKEKVISALRKTKKNFIVIVDDVDRLNPEETYAILQLVKAVSNFPRVVYVLGYDRSRVEASLAGLRIPESKTFLEKIVQLRLPLPRISSDDARRYLDLSLRGFGESIAESQFPDERDRWGAFAFRYLLPLLDKPRDYVRLANRLRFNYSLVEGELVFSDYCALEMIAVIEPSVYDHIKDNPKLYIGEDPQDIMDFDRDEKVFREEREKVLREIADVDRRKKMDQLLREIFPYAMGDPGFGKDYQKPARSSGRVANPDNFELAFYYSRPANLVTLEELRVVWKSPEERWNVMRNLGKVETGSRFLSLVDELVCNSGGPGGVQEWELPEDLLKFFVEYARFIELDGLPNVLGDGMLDWEYKQYLHRLEFWILKRMAQEERFDLAKSLCERVDSMAISSVVVSHEYWSRNRREMGRSAEGYEVLFDDAELSELVLRWKNSLTKSLQTEGFCRSRHLEISISCAVLCDCELLFEAAILREDSDIEWRARLLAGLLGRGSLNGRPYLVADQTWVIKRMNILELKRVAEELPDSIEIPKGCLKAIRRCFEKPGKRFFADTGESCGNM